MNRKYLGSLITTALLVSVLVSSGVTAAQAADPPAGDVGTQSVCDARWRYKTTGRGSNTFRKVGGEKSAYNGTKSPALVTFTSSESASVGSVITTTLNVQLSVVLASANQAYDLGLHSTLSVQKGVDIEIKVPSKRTGVGQYGVHRAYIKGSEWYENRSCTTSKKHSTKVYAPYRDGWKTWID